MNANQFLNKLHGNGEIRFRCLRRDDHSNQGLSGPYNEHMIKILEQLNKQNYDIYVVPNSGGYRDNDISRINTVFIDLDCGEADTQSFKLEKLEELHEYEHIPSFIIETKNGLHVYWLVEQDAFIEQFKECEERLISYFEADDKVKSPSNLMRVPDYFWCKDRNNKFLVKILEYNDITYDIEDIINSLPEIKPKDKGTNNKHQYNNISNYCRDSYP